MTLENEKQLLLNNKKKKRRTIMKYAIYFRYCFLERGIRNA